MGNLCFGSASDQDIDDGTEKSFEERFNLERRYSIIPDALTGLTDSEKDLLCHSWAIVTNRVNVKDTGLMLFLSLFQEYPEELQHFNVYRSMRLSDLRFNPDLRAHGVRVTYALSAYIHMVDDSKTLLDLIKKIAKSHIPLGVRSEDFDKLADVIISFIMKVCESDSTPELELAWTKFFKAHNSVFAEMENEMGGRTSVPIVFTDD